MKRLVLFLVIALAVAQDYEFDTLSEVIKFMKNETKRCPVPRCAHRVCEKYYVQTTKEGCPLCPVCITPCPMPSCAFPGFCKTFKPTVFTVNGRVCPGCPVCESKAPKIDLSSDEAVRRPCPVFRCLRPACNNPVPSTIEFNGRKCPGCPTCKKEEINTCPHVKCAAITCAAGERKVYNYLTFEGKRCRGCATCKKSNTSCPQFKCRRPACDKPVPTQFKVGDRICNGCPTCRQFVKPSKEMIAMSDLPTCKSLKCEQIGENCLKTTRIQTYSGSKCLGCLRCLKYADSSASDIKKDRASPRCPIPKCTLRACENPTPTFFTYNGRRCQGCPDCNSKVNLNKVESDRKHPNPTPVYLPECPHIRCALPQCRAREKIAYQVLTFAGKRCRGCGLCIGA